MSTGDLARIFEEWERRYRETPEEFMDAAERAGLEPATLGEEAAFTFARIAGELGIEIGVAA